MIRVTGRVDSVHTLLESSNSLVDRTLQTLSRNHSICDEVTNVSDSGFNFIRSRKSLENGARLEITNMLQQTLVTEAGPGSKTSKQTKCFGFDTLDGKSTLGRLRNRPKSTFQCSVLSCDSRCQCCCHAHVQLDSPFSFSKILGRLHLDIRLAPWKGGNCINPFCRSGGSRCFAYYGFPGWLANYALFFSAMRTISKGPELILRVQHEREDNPAFRTIDPNNYHQSCLSHVSRCAEVKELLDSGEASVLDVDSCGRNILHVSHAAKV